MEIDIKEITSGRRDCEYVWICDYRKSGGDKPIRHVKPQKVLVRSNNLTNERVDYSHSHFAVLNKKGVELKKILKPFGSTGYRFRTGTPVRVFDNEKECVKQYEKFDKIMNPAVSNKCNFEEFKSVFDFINKEQVATDLNESELRQEWGIYKDE